MKWKASYQCTSSFKLFQGASSGKCEVVLFGGVYNGKWREIPECVYFKNSLKWHLHNFYLSLHPLHWPLIQVIWIDSIEDRSWILWKCYLYLQECVKSKQHEIFILLRAYLRWINHCFSSMSDVLEKAFPSGYTRTPWIPKRTFLCSTSKGLEQKKKSIFRFLKKELEDLTRELMFSLSAVQMYPLSSDAYKPGNLQCVLSPRNVPITNHLQKHLFQFVCFCEWAHLLNCEKTLGPFKALCEMSIMDANVRDMDKSNSSTWEGFELGECHSERTHCTWICHICTFSESASSSTPDVVGHSVLIFLVLHCFPENSSLPSQFSPTDSWFTGTSLRFSAASSNTC